MPAAEDHIRSSISRRRVPTRRSQVAFMRGAWTAVRRILAAGLENPVRPVTCGAAIDHASLRGNVPDVLVQFYPRRSPPPARAELPLL